MEPKKIQVSDLEDFKETYLNYQKVIMKVAYDILDDYYTAQDVCQETFLRLGFYFDYMPKMKRLPWMMTVAGNYARDILKKGGQYEMTVGIPARTENEDVAGDFMDQYLEELVMHEELAEELRRLREKNALWYEMLLLIEYVDIPKKRVEEEYHITRSVLDGYLRRAKEWLRKTYGEKWEF